MKLLTDRKLALEFGRIGDGFKGECGREMCRICWQSHVRDTALESADFGVMAELIDQLLNAYCQESESHNYCEAILDGSWPSAVEILEHSLAKAKTRVSGQRGDRAEPQTSAGRDPVEPATRAERVEEKNL